MRPGLARVRLAPDEVVPAPRSGLALGRGARGPVQLRLFRLAGTRVVVAGGCLPAQLLILRAAGAAIPVDVVTARPAFWEPLLRSAPGAALHRPGQQPVPPRSGPALVVDDRVDDGAGQRPSLDVRPWQCRVEVRGDPVAGELGPL